MSKKVADLLLGKLGERVRKNKALAKTEWMNLMPNCSHKDKKTAGCLAPSREGYPPQQGVVIICAMDLCPFITEK